MKPGSLLRVALFLASVPLLLLSRATATDEPLWGEPANGLRVGLVCPATEWQSENQGTVTVVLENVGHDSLVLPSATSYMRRQDEHGRDLFAQPLRPNIDVVEGQPPTWSQTGGNKLEELSPETVTIAPGQRLTLGPLNLEERSYYPGQTATGDQTSLRRHWLLPDRTYRVSFTFENRQAELDGKALWTGAATSGEAVVKVTASLEGLKIKAGFKLARTQFALGEPIWVTFEVANEGERPFAFVVGGDYRSTGRPERFSLTAVDDQGVKVPDPIPNPSRGGGVTWQPKVEPGKPYVTELLVDRWCAFSKPGRYTLTCTRTLNIVREPGERMSRLPESVLPALPVETTFAIVLRADAEAFREYLDGLVKRLEGPFEGKAYEEMAQVAKSKAPAALPAIIRLAKVADPNQQQRAGWLRNYGEEANAALLEIAETGIPTARATALGALSRRDAPGLEPLVLKALKSETAQERQGAVYICERTRYPGCLETLLTMGDDPDAVTREFLCRALGAYGDERGVPILRKILLAPDASPYARTCAATALKKLGHDDGIAALIDLLKAEETRSDWGWYGSTLRTLTGQQLPATYEAWHKWWVEEGSKPPAAGQR